MSLADMAYYEREARGEPRDDRELIAHLRTERDRFKAQRDWLAAGAWQNYCPEFPPQEIAGGSVVALVVEDEDCPLGIRVDDPEHCPKCWIKAAEEATRE